MRGHPHVHVQVAVAAAPRPRCASTRQAKCGTRVHATGHIDLIALVSSDPALPTARRAWCGDHLAHTATSATRACRDHLTEEALADTLHLACATTVAAGHRLGSFTGTSGIAVTTRNRKFELDADLIAKHCLFEREVGNGLEILSSGRAIRAPAAASTAERASA